MKALSGGAGRSVVGCRTALLALTISAFAVDLKRASVTQILREVDLPNGATASRSVGGGVSFLIIFTAQIFLSQWWLARFRFGPLEWFWRCLSYG